MDDPAVEFERLYRRLWSGLHRPDESGVSHHDLELLHHVPARGTVDLGTLTRHLGIPKSTASAMVKSLVARGHILRHRDPADDRRLALTLTDSGRACVEDDTVLDVRRTARALAALSLPQQRTLLRLLTRLAEAVDLLPEEGP